MLPEIIAGFLGLSLLLYCVMAGADFGAGILELFSTSEHAEERQRVITRAVGPVWEANHVWLILAVVILFNGFPLAFSALSITYHIPLTIMLCGIILRGCAFTFRHYDIVRGRSQAVYNAIFKFSSVITPLTLGMIAGAMLLGRHPSIDAGFWDVYVRPWFNVFCFSVGLFCCVLFAFLASVYLIGETDDKILRTAFVKDARILNVAAIIVGAVVFAAAEFDGMPLVNYFFSRAISLGCVIAGTIVLVPLWFALNAHHAALARACAAFQVALILFGWFALQYPNILLSGGIIHPAAITIQNSAAGPETLHFLLYALVAGSALIFPSLFVLLKIFKSTPA